MSQDLSRIERTDATAIADTLYIALQVVGEAKARLSGWPTHSLAQAVYCNLELMIEAVRAEHWSDVVDIGERMKQSLRSWRDEN